ncbi:MAG: hypothetical protein ABL921_21380 [Pirellula sp.]
MTYVIKHKPRTPITVMVRQGPSGPEGPPGAGSTWATLSGKPATFPPSAHSHVQADVTGLRTTDVPTFAGLTTTGNCNVAQLISSGPVYTDAQVQLTGNFRLSSAGGGDGIGTLLGAGGTGWNRLNLGGTTSAFPAIKRSGTQIHTRLADDTGWASLQTGPVTYNGNMTVGTGVNAVWNTAGTGTFRFEAWGPTGAVDWMVAYTQSTGGKFLNLRPSGGASAFSVSDTGAITASGLTTLTNLLLSPSASINPGVNGQLVVEATSNTQLTLKLKGTDGVVRTNTLTLA